MAITMDWANLIIQVPRADMPVVQVSPEIRSLDADAFRLELKAIEASEEGIPFLDTHKHTTEVILSGVTYARFIEIINGYTITFEDGLYSVNLFGANTNILETTNQNQVSLRANNSSGLVRVVSEEDIWNYQGAYDILHKVEHIASSVWVDTEAVAVGDGTQAAPFNNLTTAIDYAENNGYQSLVIYSDIVIDRKLKNFAIVGIGNPTIDTNGQELSKSEFGHVKLQGSYIGTITAQECILLNGFLLNGGFNNCGLAGDLVCAGAATIILNQCVSAIAGLGRPTISMGAGTACALSLRKHGGGMTIKDCDQPTDVVTVEISEGSLTFDSSNTDGVMVARGGCKFVDQTNGAAVTNETMPELTWVHKKALSVSKFLGLK